MIVLCACTVLFACKSVNKKSTITEETNHQKNKQSIVYFTKDLTPDGLAKIYAKVKDGINGKVAIKLHTGEPHGPNIIPPSWVKPLQATIPNSNIVETNTYYIGDRRTTQQHRKTIEINGWNFCPVDIMDEDGAVMLPVKNGTHFKEMAMGKNILNYDSMLVLTHFKGIRQLTYMKELNIGNDNYKIISID